MTVAAGIASRRVALPGLLAEHTGDALYAGACYWLWALIRPRASIAWLALAAWATAALVEVSQLVHAPWLDELRRGPARWVLGQGFKTVDLLAYAVGTVLTAAVHRLLLWSPGARPRR
ncbi:MAG: DUF2809 domain-containing protein [Planctomycetota bacterium]